MKNAKLLLTAWLLTMVSAAAWTQIPNSGFENWTNTGARLDPTGWWTTNQLITTGSYFPATRSLEHYPPEIGQYSMRLENKPELLPDWAAMGIAWTGDFEGNDNPAFAVDGHPNSLWGYFRFFPENNDTFEIHVRLYKDGQDVSGGSFKTGAPVPDWTAFHLDLSDYPEADSGRIMLSSCFDNDEPSPKGNSMLYLDNLSFDQLITGNEEYTLGEQSIPVFPNPASETVTIPLDTPDPINIELYNACGQLRLQCYYPQGAGNVIVDISSLPAGLYFIRTKTNERHISVTRLMIQD